MSGEEINKLCLKCRKDCKQESHLTIVRCKLFEPVPEQTEGLKSDPRGEVAPKGKRPRERLGEAKFAKE